MSELGRSLKPVHLKWIRGWAPCQGGPKLERDLPLDAPRLFPTFDPCLWHCHASS